MIKFFVYKMLQVHGLSKPILLDTMTVDEFNEVEMPKVNKHRENSYHDPNYTFMIGFDKVKMLGWSGNVFYMRSLPNDYYVLEDGFLAEPFPANKSSYDYEVVKL